MSMSTSHSETENGALFLSGIYGESVILEEAELTAETRELLADICSSVSDIVPDFEGDMGDYAADFDEMFS